ncbi:MAG: GntR family transcriptional regulator [Bryobacterales bacterium]|nr:GntR family transcriptional regulator [Bryobacterales bacterium]
MSSAEGPPPEVNLLPIRADSLGQQLFERIRDAIFGGSIQPGAPLRELQLARSMGVSQSTVREALGLLENVGLVVRQPNRGTTVTKLSNKETGDRLRVRLALEELAMAAACPLITAQDLAQLEDLAGAITTAIEHNSHYEVSQADLAFHRRIWFIAGNPVLERTLHSISLPLFAFLGVFHKSRLVNPADAQPHDELIRALSTRDPDTARLAIRKHILLSHSSILNQTEKL